MTLDEAIAHAREVAEEQRNACNLAWVWSNKENVKKCAEEHEQLAEWMEELKEYKEIGTPEECRAAVEKQRAKRIIHEPNAGRERDWRCPNCDSYINPYAKYCIGCGQKLKGGGVDGNNRKDCLR